MYSKIEVDINEITLKVERQNAKAMVEGFMKDSERHYISIFAASKKSISLKKDFQTFPKLLENNNARDPKKIYPLSHIGKKMAAELYEVPHRYVAVLDRIFHIKNEINLWKDICTNGLFDIWEPQAPFNCLNEKENPMVLLLRIYEVDYDFKNDIRWYNDHYSLIPKSRVKLVKPVIPLNRADSSNTEFDGTLYFTELTEKLRNTLSRHGCLIKEER
jgi:hypothetical protein